MWGFYASTRLIEAERNPLKKGTSSEMLNAQSTTMELWRDPDTRRNVPVTPLLSPQPKV